MPDQRHLSLLSIVLFLAVTACTKTSEKPPTFVPPTSRPLSVATATAPAGAAVPCVTPTAAASGVGTATATSTATATATATATGTAVATGTPVATLVAGIPCPTPSPGLGALASGSATPTGTAPAGATPSGTGTPSAGAATSTPAASSGRTYTVKAGDTLGTIGAALGYSVQDLIAANPGIDPNVILVGQELKLPATASAAATARPATATAAATAAATARPATASATPQSSGGLLSGQTYTVQAGDTACKIAAQYKVSIEQLATANGTTVSALVTINVGQQLKIPASSGGAGGC